MPEPLTSQLLREELQKLIVAFPRNLGARDPTMMADVYRNGLTGLSGDSVRFAVNRSIQEDEYFPKVARLREIATEWSRRTNAMLPARQEERWDRCSVCGAEVTWPVVTRPKKDETKRYAIVLDPQTNEPVMETLTKLRSVLTHDRQRHHIYDRTEGDAA